MRICFNTEFTACYKALDNGLSGTGITESFGKSKYKFFMICNLFYSAACRGIYRFDNIWIILQCAQVRIFITKHEKWYINPVGRKHFPLQVFVCTDFCDLSGHGRKPQLFPDIGNHIYRRVTCSKYAVNRVTFGTFQNTFLIHRADKNRFRGVPHSRSIRIHICDYGMQSHIVRLSDDRNLHFTCAQYQ